MNTIYPSSFARTDGKVDAILINGRKVSGWVLRCIRGPSYFFNHHTLKWDISCRIGFDLEQPHYLMSQDEALALLPTITVEEYKLV